MKSNIKKLKKKNCAICINNNFELIEVSEMMFGTKHKFNYLLCKSCESLTIQNIPDNLEKYYPEKYYSFSNVKKGKLKSYLSYHKASHSLGAKNIIGGLLTFFFGENSNLKAIRFCGKEKKEKFILDVGSGAGKLLKKLDQHGFTNLYGIDPYLDKDVSIGNIKLRKGEIIDLVKEEKKFDIILMSHVLEHIEDPIYALSNVTSILKKNGKVIVRVPISSSNAFKKHKNDWYQIDAPRHLFIPSLAGIFLLANKLNLKIEKYFFDSTFAQFTASKNYSKGIPLINQSNSKLWEILYYGIRSYRLNKKEKGDQATFILTK